MLILMRLLSKRLAPWTLLGRARRHVAESAGRCRTGNYDDELSHRQRTVVLLSAVDAMFKYREMPFASEAVDILERTTQRQAFRKTRSLKSGSLGAACLRIRIELHSRRVAPFGEETFFAIRYPAATLMACKARRGLDPVQL